jgi:hypothetical protein
MLVFVTTACTGNWPIGSPVQDNTTQEETTYINASKGIRNMILIFEDLNIVWHFSNTASVKWMISLVWILFSQNMNIIKIWENFHVPLHNLSEPVV